jgi:hypothetical protein
MARVFSDHPLYPAPLARKVAEWCMQQIGMPRVPGVTIKVAPMPRGRTSWRGLYTIRERRVDVFIGTEVTYPTSIGYGPREAHWQAEDDLELLVSLMAHELEHCRVYTSTPRDRWPALNKESRVRTVEFRTVAAFRTNRPSLEPQWEAERRRTLPRS